jgi:hypothetical protein
LVLKEFKEKLDQQALPAWQGRQARLDLKGYKGSRVPQEHRVYKVQSDLKDHRGKLVLKEFKEKLVQRDLLVLPAWRVRQVRLDLKGHKGNQVPQVRKVYKVQSDLKDSLVVY